MAKKIKISLLCVVLLGVSLIFIRGFSSLNYCPRVIATTAIPTPSIPDVKDSSTTGGKMDEISKSVESRGLVPCKLSECTFCNLIQLIERIFFWLLSLAFIVAVFIVIVGGFLYIMAMGDSGAMAYAKDALKYAITGFAICLLSWLAIHILYLIMGYGNGEGSTVNKNWWQVECESGKNQTGRLEEKSVSKELAGEVLSDSPGGRNNPFNLSDFSLLDLAKIPNNEYFFVHGVGGQPLQEAATEIESVVRNAEVNGKIIYATIPYEDEKGNVVGSRVVNLNNYFSLKEQPLTPGNLGKNVDNFSNLALFLLGSSASHEIPLISVKNGEDPASFNGVWPETNWNTKLTDGLAPTFEAASSIVSGMHFEEGTGPFFYDPAKYDNQIPADQTHVDVNLNKDGSLNTLDPVIVGNVAKGVSKEELNSYLDQLISVLFKVQDQYDVKGKKGDFVVGLTNLLTQSISEKLDKANSSSTNVATNKNNTTAPSNTEVSDNTVSNPTVSGENEIQNTPTTNNLNQDWLTGGTGILPDKIQQTSQNNKELNDKEIEALIKSILKNQNQSGSGSSSSGGGSGSSSGGSDGTSSSGGTNSSSGNGTGNSSGTSSSKDNWSNTSIGVNGYNLSEEEKKRLGAIIEQDLKMVNLNVPSEFVMCIINEESKFKPEALNNRNEYSVGLMQINKGVGTDKAALNALKKYSPELYQKMLKQHGSDSKIIDTSSMLSRNDPPGEKGATIIALGISYLKDNNMRKRGDGLGSPSNWNDLAASYNCGAAGCRGGNLYSKRVTQCTQTMLKKAGKNPDTGQ